MSKVVVATTTFYKNTEELRFRLACDMVKAAVANGHRVVIVDASPDPTIASRLREIGALVLPQLHKGMGPGRREAFFHATELAGVNSIEHIVWTEPEKVDLVRFMNQIVEPINAVSSPIVIPKRSEVAWSSWPAFQLESEMRANTVYNNAFGGENFDPMFGPVAFHVDVAEAFIRAYCHPMDYDEPVYGTRGPSLLVSAPEKLATLVPDTYIQHYAPVLWKSRNPKSNVVSVTIDMQYPTEQRAEEEGSENESILKKRKMQLETLTTAYRALARVHGKVYTTQVLD